MKLIRTFLMVIMTANLLGGWFFIPSPRWGFFIR